MAIFCVSFSILSVNLEARSLNWACKAVTELFNNLSSAGVRLHSLAGNLNVYEQRESSDVVFRSSATHRTPNNIVVVIINFYGAYILRNLSSEAQQNIIIKHNREQGRAKVSIRTRDNRTFMVEMQFGIDMD